MSTYKKGILCVSRGVEDAGIREKTIERMEADMRARYPGRPLYRAFTDSQIRDQIREKEGILIDDVPQALKRMAADGVNEVLAQPLFVINGAENEQMQLALRDCRPHFASVYQGTPLLLSGEDKLEMVRFSVQEFAPAPGEVLLFAGHGSEHRGGDAYASLDRQFKNNGYSYVFVGTEEASPSFGTVMRKLKKLKKPVPKQVKLVPLYMAADARVCYDLAGDQDDSWKSRLEANGFSVSCRMHGLLEYQRIRNRLLDHMETAEEI